MRKELLAIVYALLGICMPQALLASEGEEVTLSFERNIGTEVSIEIECDTDPAVEGAYFLRIEQQDGVKNYIYQLKDYTIKLSGGNIRAIDCSHSDLAQIDVTRLPYLRELRIEGNNVEALDLSASKELEILDVGDNRLYDLNLAGLNKLKTLLVNGNGLAQLNIVDCPALTLIACYSNEINSDNMKLLVESLPLISDSKPARMIVIDTESALEGNSCSMSHVAIAKEKNWEMYDYKGSPQKMEPYYGNDYVPVVSSNYITLKTNLIAGDQVKLMWTTKETNTHVELEGATIVRTDNYGNGPVYVCELSGSEVKIKGDLTMLDCSDNLISSLDLSHCTILEEVYCHKNGYLKSLDVSMLPALKHIVTTDCSLEKLDLTHAPLLETAYLANMPLTEIDLSNNPLLRVLSLNWTQLQQIDLSHNAKIEDLRLNGTNIQTIDLSALPLLKMLYISEAKLTSLDVSHNPLLRRVRVGKNALTEVKLGTHQQLQELDVRSNKLSAAAFQEIVSALSPNSNSTDRRLIAVDKSDPQEANVCTVTCVSNAKAKGWTVYDFNGSKDEMKPFEGDPEEVKPYALFKTELPKGEKLFITAVTKDGSPIEVKGLTYQGSFTEGDQEIGIYLVADSVQYIYGDVVLLNLQENYLTALDITHLPSLESLTATINEQLTELDLSHSPQLKELYLASTGISSLLFPEGSQLEQLSVPSTAITSLDLTPCTVLKGLNINATSISELDLTHCPQITYISMTRVPVTALNLSQCTLLERLYLDDCKLSTLDLSHNTQLQHLYCGNNALTQIIMPASQALDNLFCYGNKLSSAAMHAIVEALPDRSGKEQGRFVVVNNKAATEANECTKEQVDASKQKNWAVYDYNGDSLNMLPYEGITSNTLLTDQKVKVYRDPTTQMLYVTGLEPLEEVSLYLATGELLGRTLSDVEGSCTISLATIQSTPLIMATAHHTIRVM